MIPTTDPLGLTAFRTEVAQFLTDDLPEDVGVLVDIPDSIAPPLVYVTWSTPWLVATTWCQYTANLQLIIVTQRLEPGGQFGVLESIMGDVVECIRRHRLTMRDATSPYPILLAGVNYLAASVNIIHELGE